MARAGVTFDVIGITGFTGDVHALREDIRVGLEDIVDDAAHAIQASARVNVPRDKGDLARAIAQDGRGLSRRVGIADAAVPSRGGKNFAHLNPWVYGLWVEKGLRSRHQGAQPFMGPAADAHEPIYQNAAERILNGVLT